MFGTECCTTVHMRRGFEKLMEGMSSRRIIGYEDWTNGDLREVLVT